MSLDWWGILFVSKEMIFPEPIKNLNSYDLKSKLIKFFCAALIRKGIIKRGSSIFENWKVSWLSVLWDWSKKNKQKLILNK